MSVSAGLEAEIGKPALGLGFDQVRTFLVQPVPAARDRDRSGRLVHGQSLLEPRALRVAMERQDRLEPPG